MEPIDNSDVASGSVSNTKDESKYEAAFLKNVNHAITYQLKISMWVAWQLHKADASMKNWKIATEVRNARGFHDLMLMYEDTSNKYKYRFVDIKHRLLLKKDDVISIELKEPIKEKPELTNKKPKSTNKKPESTNKTPESTNKKPESINMKPESTNKKPELTNKKPESTNKKPESTNKKQENIKYYLMKLFASYQEVHNSMEIEWDQIQDITIFTNCGMDKTISFIMKDERVEEILGFEGIERERYRINCNEFSKPDSDLANQLRRDMDHQKIELFIEFLGKLVFAVGQPCESELQDLIIKDMNKTFSMPKIFYNALYKNMIDWFLDCNKGKSSYLTKDHLNQYVYTAKKKLGDAEKECTNAAISSLEDFSSLKMF